MSTHVISINNIPLPASAPFQWALKAGVKPTIMEYDVTENFYAQLVGSISTSNMVKLQVVTDTNQRIEISNLYYLGNSVGSNPYIKKIIIADRRWMWDRHAIYRKYNIRRHAGVKRIAAIDVKELQLTAPVIRYAKYSVQSTGGDNVTKWTAKEVLDDIVNSLVTFEREFNPNAAGYVFRGGFKKDIPVENFSINDSGSSALNKALGLIAGSEVYIDYDGRIIIYDKSDKGETDAENAIASGFISGNTPMMMNFGNMEKLDKSFLRPKEVRVMFHREIEVRFDANESDPYVPDPDKRYMENVVSIPDWTLDNKVQGTWMEIKAVLDLWNAEWLANPNGAVAEFSLRYLRKAFVPFIDFWSPFLLNGVLEPNRDWAARVASVMTHWRRTFRVNSNWIDRISKLKAYRVGTIDRATGQRAPAIAYANYCQLYTERSFYWDIARGGKTSYASNFPVGLESDVTEIASTHKPAPVKVAILDEDQGIINLDFLSDVYRLRENTIPGIMGEEGDILPIAVVTSDISMAGVNNVLFDAVGKNNKIPEIIDGTEAYRHITTVILTVISASPNDNRQYQVVIKKPDELKELPAMAAYGPPMEVIVGAGIETARIRWLDSRKADIEKLFGIGLPDGYDEIKLSKLVEDLVINRGEDGTPVDLYGSLEEIAKAVAYRVYLSLADRIAGSAAIMLNPGITLRGYLDEISHEINPDGVALTRISSPVDIPELDLLGLLDENTRTILMRVAEVGK